MGDDSIARAVQVHPEPRLVDRRPRRAMPSGWWVIPAVGLSLLVAFVWGLA